MSLSRSREQRLEALEKIVFSESRTPLAWGDGPGSLWTYRPYPKQIEFHAAGASYRERMLRAGNKCGKTYPAGHEVAMHLTGLYPEGWKGRRFEKPIRAWVAGETGETTRDVPQTVLLGPAPQREAWGHAAIPKKALASVSMSRGLADAVDTAVIRHVSGGHSLVQFKSFIQGRLRWQGADCEVIWLDEEADEEIYSEALTRTTAVQGLVMTTFTPLLGETEIVRRFSTAPDAKARHLTQMSINDALHFTDEQRKVEIAKYRPHERDARAFGVPQLGSGRVFPFDDDLVSVAPFEVPMYWPQIGALDFGWDHPTAAVRLAWDRDDDVLYVTAAYRQREATPIVHAAALKPWGDGLPFAWPHDGLQHDKGSGHPLRDSYAKQGLEMLPAHATFPDGATGVEAGVIEMYDRMQTGRFKVFAHLSDWFEEFRSYHRKDGQLVKVGDDLMSATRYGMMMLRFAKTGAEIRTRHRRAYFVQHEPAGCPHDW